MRKLFFIGFLLISFSVSAHIGSPDIVYSGNAGPYPVMVTIQPPDVVPGVANILIETDNKKNVKTGKVIVQPVYYQYGSEGAPAGDAASAVPGKQNVFQGKLWLMTFGSSSVKITVEGSEGVGSTIIPVPAVATATRTMDNNTGFILSLLGIFLFASFVTIIGACVKEATLFPGIKTENGSNRKAKVVMTVTGAVIAGVLFICGKWWDKVEMNYRKNMYRPMTITSVIEKQEAGNRLILKIENQEWLSRKVNDLVADHGKIMHLFLVNTINQNFAHIHPERLDSVTFSATPPNLEPGKYVMFAEVVHSDGITETMTDTLELKSRFEEKNGVDDFAGKVKFSKENRLPGGIILKSVSPDNMKAGTPVRLEFACIDSTGKPAVLEPYLGMSGHAVILKNDASVFIHLHPMGTISMASQKALAGKLDENVTICGSLEDSVSAILASSGVADKSTVSLMKNGTQSDLLSGKITFPYIFPRPGKYLIYVQVRHLGEIKTAGFEYSVQ